MICITLDFVSRGAADLLTLPALLEELSPRRHLKDSDKRRVASGKETEPTRASGGDGPRTVVASGEWQAARKRTPRRREAATDGGG